MTMNPSLLPPGDAPEVPAGPTDDIAAAAGQLDQLHAWFDYVETWAGQTIDAPKDCALVPGTVPVQWLPGFPGDIRYPSEDARRLSCALFQNKWESALLDFLLGCDYRANTLTGWQDVGRSARVLAVRHSHLAEVLAGRMPAGT